MKKLLAFMFLMSNLVLVVQSQINWAPADDIASASYGNHHPRIVTDAIGDPMLIWGHNAQVMFSRWTGTDFSTPVVLSGTVTAAEASWMGPDIAAHGDTVYAVFKQSPEAAVSSHIFCVHSFDGGLSFSAPVQVDHVADSLSRFPTVTTDDFGNPLVAFMKFDPGFTGARWVLAKSTDFGLSFANDVKASGWSSPGTLACDCCPGAVTASGNKVAVIYRDNNSNIRDTWAGISGNSGSSFSGGMNVDQQNWNMPACPASGPDGVITGDTLYTAFMNGASGTNRVYFNKSSISAMTSSPGILMTGTISGLAQQNYPRLSVSQQAAAVVWKQIVSGSSQLAVLFTGNLSAGFSSAYEVLASDNVENADVALAGEKICVVWEDYNTGTIRYRSGTYSGSSGIPDKSENRFSVFPNPSSYSWTIQAERPLAVEIELFNSCGALVYHHSPQAGLLTHIIDNTSLSRGLYILKLSYQDHQQFIKLIRQ